MAKKSISRQKREKAKNKIKKAKGKASKNPIERIEAIEEFLNLD